MMKEGEEELLWLQIKAVSPVESFFILYHVDFFRYLCFMWKVLDVLKVAYTNK